MRPMLITFAHAIIGASASVALCSYGAEISPTRPVRFIMPFAAGASADIAGRAIAYQLARMWGQQVIVDNRPGAGTIIGTQALALAPADGYTFGWVITAHAINPTLYSKLPYDTLRDFSGVTLAYQLRTVILAGPSFPVNTVSELAAFAKARPGQLTYASPGTGTSVHLLGELFKLKYGVDIAHIGYKGGSTAHPDVMSGRVPLMFDALPNSVAHIKLGKLKAIAVIGDAPVTQHPELPTLAGLLPADASVGWNGIVVPARTPKAIVARLSADIITAVRSLEVQERFAALTVETRTTTPDRFDAFIREDMSRWADVIKRANIKLDQGG